MGICNFQFKCNFVKNQKLFLNFLFHFWILYQFLNILKEKMIVIANAFPKLQTVSILVRPFSKKRCFRTRVDSQDVKASQMLTKSPWERFYHVFSSFLGKFICKTSPLVLADIVGLSANTLTSDRKYRIQGFQNLSLPIQMQFSGKRNTFSEFFFPLLDSTWNFEHFERKDDRHS